MDTVTKRDYSLFSKCAYEARFYGEIQVKVNQGGSTLSL
jgi:hypothetical protein